MRESDLFGPVKEYLEGLGYAVAGEVLGCDLTATREDELLVAELKTGFTLKLVYQALDRQRISPNVLMAIPRPKIQRGHSWQDMLRLVRRLDMGLLTVAVDSPLKTVEAHAWPSGSTGGQLARRRQALERELSGRKVGQNAGGVTRQRLMTAYREELLHMAAAMERFATLTPAQCRALGLNDKRMARDAYGWFRRREKGVYELSAAGWEALADPEFAAVVAFYRKQVAGLPDWAETKEEP